MHELSVISDAKNIQAVLPPRDHRRIRAEGDRRAFGREAADLRPPGLAVIELVIEFILDFDHDVEPVDGPGSRSDAFETRLGAQILPGGPLGSVPVFVVQGEILADAEDVEAVFPPGRDGQRGVLSERMVDKREDLPTVPLMAIPVQVRHFAVGSHTENIQAVFPPADDAGRAGQRSLEGLQRPGGWSPFRAVVILVQELALFACAEKIQAIGTPGVGGH